MNSLFHLASALGALVLVALLLGAQRQRDFLRELLAAQRPGRTRVHVAAPAAFLKRFAAAVGAEFDGDGADLVPRRISAAGLAGLHLRAGVALIRCQADGAGQLAVELVALGPSAADAALQQALGDGIKLSVSVQPGPDRAS